MRASRGRSGPDTVGAAGERAVLERVLARIPPTALAEVGPGDDAAVVAAPDGRYVVTTDLMVEGPDFRLAWHGPFELGWKAAATNLADLAAMGARPAALTVGIACPPELPVPFLEEFAEGLVGACAAMAPGCGVVGGDLSASRELMISVTALGDMEGRRPVLRSGARPGDVVAVAGELGLAAAGLALLFARASEGGTALADPVSALWIEEPELLAAQLAPSPPISAGPLAALAGATAMLDVSDGLLLDAWRVARASTVRIELESAALGPQAALALGGGEDHALLATFPAGIVLPQGFRRIGAVAAAGAEGPAVAVDGVTGGPEGWDPYTASWASQSAVSP